MDHVLETSGLKKVLSNALPSESDTLLALIAFKLLDGHENFYAERWFIGSYAQHLYPTAVLAPPRLSEFMRRLGQETTHRIFFDAYVPYLKAIPKASENVIIDGADLQNDLLLEDAGARQEATSDESRVTRVVERNTGLPVYFRYVADYYLDVRILRVTTAHLKARDAKVKHGLLDAGYCSKQNVKDLYDNDIPFLIRLPNNALAKRLIGAYGDDVLSEENAFEHGDRLIFLKRVAIDLFGHDAFAFIGVDFERQNEGEERRFREVVANRDKEQKENQKKEVEKHDLGFFALVSSEKLRTSEVSPLWRLRGTLERTFDLAKNEAAPAPGKPRDEEAVRGHLLLSFMAAALSVTVERKLKTRKKTAALPTVQALQAMRHIKGDIFPNFLVTSKPSQYADLIVNELKLTVPGIIDI
ncbi:MAG: transposase [Deltaproteobacteria bacterium]|nr:transposase [Deltaproteobacteria bacterium]